jgi:lipopolysaccharide biosynthesis glycosyltransferase
MKNCVCTIVTPDFLANGLTTLHSMRKFYKNSDFNILYMDNYLPNCSYKNFNIFDLNFIEEYENVSKKYGIISDGAISDKTRWTLKPLFILNLLKKYEKVIYVDPDMFFVNNWDFLFDEIDGVLLTRHWRAYSPEHVGFGLNFTDGIFNAGFLGVSNKGIDAIKWWKDACLWRCEYKKSEGLFVDQKYLDFMFVHFPYVEYCKHQGCNLAGWNYNQLKRKLYKNKIIINDIFEAIFLHFSFINKEDEFVINYYQKYEKLVDKINKKLCNI